MIRDILRKKVDLGRDGCHNMGEILLIYFHVSDHLDLFGGVLFWVKLVINNFD